MAFSIDRWLFFLIWLFVLLVQVIPHLTMHLMLDLLLVGLL